jgi:hypothetical protein
MSEASIGSFGACIRGVTEVRPSSGEISNSPELKGENMSKIVQRLAAEIDRIALSTREPTTNETPMGETEWAHRAPGQMALPTVTRERQTGSYSQSRTTRGLASLAVRARIEEAELTPKPALVDGRGGGAQETLSVSLMRRSAQCLAPFFELIALTSLEEFPPKPCAKNWVQLAGGPNILCCGAPGK